MINRKEALADKKLGGLGIVVVSLTAKAYFIF
jgi:hypothetical protein